MQFHQTLATPNFCRSWNLTMLEQACTRVKFIVIIIMWLYFGNDHLRTRTEIHLLPVHDRHTHALSRNTKYALDNRLPSLLYRRPFTDVVKLRGYISWSWGALIGLHGVPNCSSRQSGSPLWIVSVYVTYRRHSTALWVWMGALTHLQLPTCSHHPSYPPPTQVPPILPPLTHPPVIDSIRDIAGTEKNHLKN